jgi:hypothetical protein
VEILKVFSPGAEEAAMTPSGAVQGITGQWTKRQRKPTAFREICFGHGVPTHTSAIFKF